MIKGLRDIVIEKSSLLTNYFQKANIYTVEIEYKPSYNKLSFEEYGYFTPPMPFIIGPVSCYDLGPEHRIEITSESGEKLEIEIENDLNIIKLRFEINNRDNTIKILDKEDKLIGEAKFDSKFKLHKEFKLGTGIYERHWKGKVLKLDMDFEFKNNSEIKISQHNLRNYTIKETLDDAKEPIVSVIMPVYNAEQFIIESVHCVLNQNYKSIELILVDDASTDKSVETVLSHFDDKRIRIIDNIRSKGVSGARNTGILASIGKYVCFLDSDDYFDADCISKRVDFLEKNQNSNCVFCRTVLVDPKRNKLDWVLEAKPIVSFEDFHGNPIHTNSIMIRKSNMGSILYNETMTNGEDWLFHSQFARKGNDWYRIDGTKCYYRQHMNTVRSDFLGHETKLQRVLDIIYSNDPGLKIDETSPYYNGLNHPELNLVKFKRHLGLLFYLGLSDATNDYKNLKNKYPFSKFWDKKYISSTYLLNSLKFSVSRCFLCSTKFYKDYLYRELEGFYSFLKRHLSENGYRFISSILQQEFKDYKPVNLDIGSSKSEKGLSIIFYPEFEDKKEYTRELLRLGWYINPLQDKFTDIIVKSSFKKIGKVPDDFDPKTGRFFKNIESKIRNVSDFDFEREYDYLFRWKSETDDTRNRNIKHKKLLKIDSNHDKFAASFYLKFSSEFSKDLTYELKEESRTKFFKLYKNIKARNFSKSYIFGTGPNLKQFDRYNDEFENCLTIACNSMVKNKALLRKIKPNIFVAADPIFHAGCSSYAAAYRTELVQCLNMFPDAYFLVPERDYQVYKSNLTEINDNRIIGIPFHQSEYDNLFLDKKFYVKVYSNILTLFLIPLATTFTKNVFISGCDGKKELDNEYFWSHNKDVQFEDEMEKIKTAHPSFFNVNYDEYYIDHCNTLENQIRYCQSKGITIHNLTESYIPILKEISVDSTSGQVSMDTVL